MCNPLQPHVLQHEASLSLTVTWSMLKLMSSESVMPSKHLSLCCLLLLLPSIFPSIRVFSNESVLCSRQSTKASASVLPMNIQVWFPLGLTNSNTIMLIINPKFLSWCIIRCNLVCLLRSFQSCFPLLISLFLSLLLLIFNYFNIIPSLLCLRKLWTMGISEHDDKTWKWREVSEIFG